MICSINCTIFEKNESYKDRFTINVDNVNIRQYVYEHDSMFIKKHQQEIYNDIAKLNMYEQIVQIYPNVLAKIISEY